MQIFHYLFFYYYLIIIWPIVNTCKTSIVNTCIVKLQPNSYNKRGLSWSWSYGSWICNYLCNQCLSPLTLWVWTLLRRGVLDTLCDSLSVTCDRSVVSSTNKTDCHDITRILLTVVLNTIKPNQTIMRYQGSDILIKVICNNNI